MNKQSMLKSVENYLSKFGEPDKRILNAMNKINRKDFVEYKKIAYLDESIYIGHGQTISQPSTIARMLSLLKLKKGESVLEIGTGSGWNITLIAYLVYPGKVLSLEIIKELAGKAKKSIKKYKLKNIVIKEEDFRKLKQKFNKIIFTAGISFYQEKEIESFGESHLKQNGILVCPYESGPLLILKKINNKIKKTYTKEEYRFVPLIRV